MGDCESDDPRPACLREMTDELASVLAKYARVSELERVPAGVFRRAMMAHGLAVLSAAVEPGDEQLARDVLDDLLAERGRA